jgi:DNA-binding response OmpR family regulator
VDDAGLRSERVLVVDDDPPLRRMLARTLRAEGYEVSVAADGPAALLATERAAPDLIVLDVAMPAVDGLSVARRLRDRGLATPILMLTARDAVSDRVAGLEAGADDYVTKPFVVTELSARIAASLRRARSTGTSTSFSLGEVEVVPDEGTVRRAGVDVHCTRTEFRLLCELGASPGKVHSREQLLDRVWGYDYFGDGRLVDVHIRRLRTKVEDDPANPRHIITVRGMGYKLVL